MKFNNLIMSLISLSSAAATAGNFDVPAECKNLALMEAQLLQTGFHNDNMGAGAYNPSKLVLATKNGFKIGKITYLGGDGDQQGNLPCETDKNLCTNPAGAGGVIDWAQVEVTDAAQNVVAEVIVSMGSRGGCTLSSGKVPATK